MRLSLNQNRRGFTLVEIMIVVAIIALLASIAVPNFLRSRKRSQATLILEDLRVLDQALDLYAVETPNENISWDIVKRYLKTGTRLYTTPSTDILGNTYGVTMVDKEIRLTVSPSTYSSLSDVAPADFWGAYKSASSIN